MASTPHTLHWLRAPATELYPDPDHTWMATHEGHLLMVIDIDHAWWWAVFDRDHLIIEQGHSENIISAKNSAGRCLQSYIRRRLLS